MSNPSWLLPKEMDNSGHVPARMETMTSITNPSISVSTHQTPKKFAPVVAPKPKFNPYKQNGQPVVQVSTEGEFPLPPPSVEGLSHVPAEFPPPPTFPSDQYEPHASSEGQTGKRSLEERRSSLDAEIDSLTSILADLESSSPYQPRPRQSLGASMTGSLPAGQMTMTTATPSPVIGHQRMVIPSQPLLTATKKTAMKPQAPQSAAAGWKPPAQPVPASYSTASTPSQPAFNVQVKSAQPNPHFAPPGARPGGPDLGSLHQQYKVQPSQYPEPARPTQYPQQPRSADPGYRPPAAWCPDPNYGYAPSPSRSQDVYPMAPGYAGEPAHSNQNPWRPELAYTPTTPGASSSAYRQPEPPRKAYITEPARLPAAPLHQPKNAYQLPAPGPVPAPAQGLVTAPFPSPVPGPALGPVPAPAPGLVPAPASNAPAPRPEDELDRLTKKMLFDMEHPPSDDYFGQCVRCGESVVGEGAGCTAMEQVFHVDCFTCVTCGHKLRGQAFYAVEKRSYCEPCYISTLEQCSVCSKPIMERILRATGKAYHPQCFTCVVCQRSLDGIPFTVDSINQIYCIEDFHKKFAPRCFVCNQAIMPADGQEETVRIVALERDFHLHCYRCEDCGTLLSDGETQGCYPLDGHIYCRLCNGRRIQTLTAKATTDL